jgi:serine kinase of HPr protein (carbohydrate metabolism regulator)
MMRAHQATAVAIGGRSVLIEGEPGSGKSSLALALIDRGAVLIGDDAVMLEYRAGHILARPHPQTRGLIEVRGLGLLPTPVCEEAPVALVLRLDPAAPRFIERADSTALLEVILPLVSLAPGYPALVLAAELALAHYGLADGISEK